MQKKNNSASSRGKVLVRSVEGTGLPVLEGSVQTGGGMAVYEDGQQEDKGEWFFSKTGEVQVRY